jgi:toxin CcdB
MTTQFDVFPNPSRRGRNERPFVVVLQIDWIEMDSRVCAPLVAAQFIHPEPRLTPQFRIEGQFVHLHPAELLTVPTRLLRHAVFNLSAERDRIIAALDLVFVGI